MASRSCSGRSTAASVLSPCDAHSTNLPGQRSALREYNRARARRRIKSGGEGLTLELVGIGILQTVAYLLFVRTIDLYEREELKYVIPVFLWGFSVAAVISLIFNTLFFASLSVVVSFQA